MPTVITDKSDFDTIEDIINQFEKDAEVDIYSSKMSTIDQAIAMGQIEIARLIILEEKDKLQFVLSNGTVIDRKISQFPALDKASKLSLDNFENMGNGIIWEEIPNADISLKHLLEEEILLKFNLKVA
ncbi:DUF2442 domain-containing protein [Litoribacter populi]|uniref:DUF2442 domain-containing protein n=1 Tax=Litoribacter populi TaxID=2598460 RepID=UPI00117F1757|nr:DUF2442 domain-containing protein [Litoribacter populi]